MSQRKYTSSPEYESTVRRTGANGDRTKAAGGGRRFPPKVAAERRATYSRLAANAEHRAHLLLAREHKAEYDALYAREKAAIFAAYGPLPGDEYLDANDRGL